MRTFTNNKLSQTHRPPLVRTPKRVSQVLLVERTRGGGGVIIERTYHPVGATERVVETYATEQEAEMVLRGRIER